MLTTAQRYRVMVVQAQPIIAKALCHLLAGDRELDVVADLRDVDSVALSAQQPDLLILDLDGVAGELEDFVSAVHAASPATRVVVLTSHVGQQGLQRSLGCGIDGYIVKDISPAELMRACKTVARGETYFDPRVAGGLLRRLKSARPAEDELSLRESEIIRLIAAGLSNKEIAGRLDLSEKTIKNHISRIFSKLQVTARTQAAIYAIRHGIA